MRFRLIADGGALLDEGDGRAELAGGALVVTPDAGAVLRVSPADVVAITEPEPFVVALALADGARLELSRLGAMRTQLLAELAEARVADTERTLLLDGVGTAETFPGAADGVEADLRLYDDALVIVPAGGLPEKLPYPFIRSLTPDPSGYTFQVDVVGRPPIVIGRLARRTSEFADLLRARMAEAAGRTAHFIGALLPGLGPVALRSVTAQVRDGLAAARPDLEAVEPTVFTALLDAATRPERIPAARHLTGLGGQTWIGFKQTASVLRPATGGTRWRDPSPGPNYDHGGWDSSPYLLLGFIGFTPNVYADGPHLPRAAFPHQSLTPAHTDYAALTERSDDPAVLAFLLCLTPTGRLVYEVLNAPDHATYVFSCRDRDQAAQLNRALDLLGFRVEGVAADTSSAASAYRKAAERLPALRVLRERYAGRVVHTDGWSQRLAGLLG